jgi:hypothetical protein
VSFFHSFPIFLDSKGMESGGVGGIVPDQDGDFRKILFPKVWIVVAGTDADCFYGVGRILVKLVASLLGITTDLGVKDKSGV